MWLWLGLWLWLWLSLGLGLGIGVGLRAQGRGLGLGLAHQRPGAAHAVTGDVAARRVDAARQGALVAQQKTHEGVHARGGPARGGLRRHDAELLCARWERTWMGQRR